MRTRILAATAALGMTAWAASPVFAEERHDFALLAEQALSTWWVVWKSNWNGAIVFSNPHQQNCDITEGRLGDVDTYDESNQSTCDKVQFLIVPQNVELDERIPAFDAPYNLEAFRNEDLYKVD